MGRKKGKSSQKKIPSVAHTQEKEEAVAHTQEKEEAVAHTQEKEEAVAHTQEKEEAVAHTQEKEEAVSVSDAASASEDISVRKKEERKDQLKEYNVNSSKRKQNLNFEKSDLFPPKRKDNGTLGEAIKLRANHFIFTFERSKVIYHYDVDIKPAIRNQVRKKIINQMAEDNQNIFSKTFWAYDGVKNIYSNIKLELKNDEEEFPVLLVQGTRKSNFTVNIKKVAEVKLEQLQRFLEGKVRKIDQAAIQALDVVLRYHLSKRFRIQGRLIFPETERAVSLGKGLEMWHGFYQSLRPGQMKTLQLNLDVSNRPFYVSQDLLNFVSELFRKDLNSMKNWSMTSNDKKYILRHIKGMTVETTHVPENSQSYTVYKLTEESAKNLQFKNEKDEMITVEKYFGDKYKTLEYPNLPCVHCNPPNRNTFIPLEFCLITPGQRVNNKNLSSNQSAAMIKASAVAADIREKKIKDIILTLDLGKDEFMKAYALRIDIKQIHTVGRILSPPVIKTKNDKVVPEKGVWNMRGKELFEAVTIKTWIALLFVKQYEFMQQALDKFLNDLFFAGKKLGSYMDKPHYVKYCENMEDAKNAFDSVQENEDVQLVLAILPEDSVYYEQMKRFGDTEVGTPTQCVLLKNARKSDPATLNNIFLKINSKLGGRNNIVKFEKLSASIFEKPVMILGADVTHPIPHSFPPQPSIAAVLGSLDRYAVKFKAKVKVQNPTEETVNDLKDMVKDLLNEFHKNLNKAIPVKIIYYRDGVGEGQFQQILQYELKAIQKACQEFNPKCVPQITVIIVQKRHNTRFFCDIKDAVGRSKNIPPGTVVDTDIVHPIENDFYLCSHQGIQGTSKPTHYHVLWDDSNFSPNELHQLTYEMCHTYSRCTRAVSIPTPTYYAHLSALRAREHLKEIQKEFEKSGKTEIDWFEKSGKTEIDKNWLEKMQKAIEVHEDLGNMYFT